MNKQIGPKVKQLWNVAMHEQHNFWGAFHTPNSLPLGPILPSSPSTKEVHGMAFSSYLPESHPGQSGMATFGLTWIVD